jgi:hypothetical protein
MSRQGCNGRPKAGVLDFGDKPPGDPDLERQLLGSIIIDPKRLEEVTPIVGRDDFGEFRHRPLWEHLCAMPPEVAADQTLLIRWLTQAGDIDSIGGAPYLADIMQSVAVPWHARYYAEQVRDLAIKRRLADEAIELFRAAHNPTLTAGDVQARADELRHKLNWPGQGGAMVRNLDQIEARAICWLWPGRIPIGKYTELIGYPGTGKSLLTCDIAARVSRGLPWPDCPALEGPGGVVMMTAEDDLADTVKPRLLAAGADVSRICALEAVGRIGSRSAGRAVSLDKDVPAIAQAIRQTRDCRLVVVDPITAFCGDTDSHKAAEVRALLMPLTAMAAELGVAFVGVSHFNKGGGGGPAIGRGMGSLAWVAAARMAWGIVRDDEDQTARLMIPLKCNLAADATGLSYKIMDVDGVPATAWSSEPVTKNIDELLTAMAGGKRQSPQRQGVIAWLRDLLASGRLPSDDVWAKANEAGHSERLMKWAKNELGVRAYREGFGDGAKWYWELPFGSKGDAT